MTKKMLLTFAMILALVFALQACADDDEDTDGDNTPTEDGDDDTSNTEDTEDTEDTTEDTEDPVDPCEGVECGEGEICEDGECVVDSGEWTPPVGAPDCELVDVDFQGIVYEFGADTENPESFPAGVTIVPLYNANGAVQEDVDPVVSAEGGLVSFTGLKTCADDGMVAFKAEGQEGVYVDTYKFQMHSDNDATIYIVPQSTYYMAPAAAGLELEEGTAVVAGAVYHLTEDMQTQTPVGCASVELVPESGENRYFSDAGLPTKLEDQESTNPTNGLYIIANVNPGMTQFKAMVDGTEVGMTALVGYPDSIAIANIYVIGGENPGCAPAAE